MSQVAAFPLLTVPQISNSRSKTNCICQKKSKSNHTYHKVDRNVWIIKNSNVTGNIIGKVINV